MLNHQHLLVKANLKTPPVSIKKLNKWIKSLVSDIDMKILMGPYSKYIDEPGNKGISGMVVITTSHFSIHVFENIIPTQVQLDLYSCKDFDYIKILDKLKDFNSYNEEFILIDRNKDLAARHSGFSV